MARRSNKRHQDPPGREASLQAIRRQNTADAKRARLMSVVGISAMVVLVLVVVVALVLLERAA